MSELSQRRLQLIHTRTAETNRADHYLDPLSRRQTRQLQQLLEKQISACDAAIAKLIAADPALKNRAQRLDAIPGVGVVTAATVLAELPELGQISNQAAAAPGRRRLRPTAIAVTKPEPVISPVVVASSAAPSTWPP